MVIGNDPGQRIVNAEPLPSSTRKLSRRPVNSWADRSPGVGQTAPYHGRMVAIHISPPPVIDRNGLKKLAEGLSEAHEEIG
jgi:hypothetical protein